MRGFGEAVMHFVRHLVIYLAIFTCHYGLYKIKVNFKEPTNFWILSLNQSYSLFMIKN